MKAPFCQSLQRPRRNHLIAAPMSKPLATAVAIAARAWVVSLSFLSPERTEAQAHQTSYHSYHRKLQMTHYRDSSGAVHISLRGPFAGRQLFAFRGKTDPRPFGSEAHLSGVNRSSGISSPPSGATLSLFKDTVFLFSNVRRRNRAFSFHLPGALETSSHTISRSSFSLIRAGHTAACGTVPAGTPVETPHKTLTTISDGRTRDLQVSRNNIPSGLPSLREVEMGIFYDSALAHHGAASVAEHLSATIFAANELYLRRVGIQVRVNRLQPLESAASATAINFPERLLESFRSSIIPLARTADLFHFFTGAELQDGTAGVAYVGAACLDRGKFAVGLSRILNPALQTIVFSHEVSHGLGAEHDNAPRSLMHPVLTDGNNRIYGRTRNSVDGFLKKYGSCISALRPPVTTLQPTLDERQFVALVSIHHPPPRACTVSLQGRLLTLNHPGRGPIQTDSWRTITTSKKLAPSPVSQRTLHFFAPAPIVSSTKKEHVQLRALVRCGRLGQISRARTVPLVSLAPIGTEEIINGDWIDQLSGSIQVAPE